MPAPDDRGTLRARLVAEAGAILEAGGPEALQARKLAAEVGTSTQAIYTNFGGMPGLLQAVIVDSLMGFAAYVRLVEPTDDAVADFLCQGWAYATWALTHPQRYRLMFGLGAELRPELRLTLDVTGTEMSLPEGRDALSVLIGGVERMQATGRLRPGDPVVVAGQFLSATHGYVLLELAGGFGASGKGAAVIEGFTLALLVGLGDERGAAERSWARALARIGELPTDVPGLLPPPIP